MRVIRFVCYRPLTKSSVFVTVVLVFCRHRRSSVHNQPEAAQVEGAEALHSERQLHDPGGAGQPGERPCESAPGVSVGSKGGGGT